MLTWLLGRKPHVRCWLIKQIDDDMLHLAGFGTLVAGLRRHSPNDLHQGRYRGRIRLAHTEQLLDADWFERLVPLSELQLGPYQTAFWQNRTWRVSHVPQRCYAWKGRLRAHPTLLEGHSSLVSREETGDLGRRVDSGMPAMGTALFGAVNALEEPLTPEWRRQERAASIRYE